MGRVPDILFVDGSQGASGDMLLGALVELGLSAAALRRIYRELPVDGWTLRSTPIVRSALAGRRVHIGVRGKQPGRGWSDLQRILKKASGLSASVRQRSLAVFRRLLEAEATVHGSTFERVHLHEAGGVDAILDIVGVCWGLEQLGNPTVVCSPLTTGFGAVDCAHGRYPVPAPATLELMRGRPLMAGDLEMERLTPTGAALLTTLTSHWGPMPAMVPQKIGYGAGAASPPGIPNMLRAVLGHSSDAAGAVMVMECSIDDATPQSLAYAAECLFAAGALDVTFTPLTMKKGRPGHGVTVVTPADRQSDMLQVLYRETTTLGVRFRVEQRSEADRTLTVVETEYGKIEVKIGRVDGTIVNVWPEYESAARAARRCNVSLATVQHAAIASYPSGPRKKKRRRS